MSSSDIWFDTRVLLADGAVPSELRHLRFLAVPLTEETAALDLEAYRASPDVIRTHSDGRWPVDLDAATNVDLVRQHWADHQARRAFAFTLLTPTRDAGLGCLYLNPLVGTDAAMATFWLRQDQRVTGLAEVFVDALVLWLRDDWPLEDWVVRVLPDEHESVAALDASDLVRTSVDVPGEQRPYLWFGLSARRAGR